MIIFIKRILGIFLLFSVVGCSIISELGASEPPMTPLPTFSASMQTPNPPTVTVPSIDITEPPLLPSRETTPIPEAQTSPTEVQLSSEVVRFPDPAGYGWELVVDGLTSPIGLEHAQDGSGRLFVVEQPGLIRIIQDGSLAPTPFLDIRSRVGSSGSEQGLLGLAFHPRYSENGYFFVNYTDRSGDTVIARYRVSADASLADPTTEIRLLEVNQPYANHNGGDLAFGSDGFLYISLGDGGSGGDPRNYGQSLDTLLGKILRIEVGEAESYSIPADNPFVEDGGRPEIWAYGLRNPWRFSFDRLSGDLFIADVGQNSWEEVNFQPAGSPGGQNYGWKIIEGFHCFQTSPCDQSELTLPVVEYALHVEGDCAVSGGYAYRGTDLPAWNGIYLYGDYCSGRVWGLFQDTAGVWQNALLFETGSRITAFGQDEVGEIYLVSHSGSIYRLMEK